MAVPILRQRDLLTASIQVAQIDEELLALRDALAAQVGGDRATAVIIDVSALDVMDPFATRTLRSIACSSRLRGPNSVEGTMTEEH